ncbi:hypothetical protein GJU40_19685 [Bacillus lacus]|uniref:Uncharacterized protein n=1 Tax=Metabacillus lacus TaxID=1983721 RepID=A0A7X2M1G5_9BACI|nr:hypothetical protein [Metabacillus lacus]MRX74344.1 hypothetical protein [Metabacillus lacus]
MKRMPFEPPTEFYDERLSKVDEQICSLLKQRRDISNNTPGFPSDAAISNWALKYDLYEEFLNALFRAIRMYDFFKIPIEPAGFRKHISVLKSIEKNNRIYSITVIRQYENASVLQLHIDWDEPNDSSIERHHHNGFELFLGEQYHCRQDRAAGSTGHYTYNFIISPPLPDDVSNTKVVFREYSDTFLEKPTGLEIVMNIE